DVGGTGGGRGFGGTGVLRVQGGRGQGHDDRQAEGGGAEVGRLHGVPWGARVLAAVCRVVTRLGRGRPPRHRTFGQWAATEAGGNTVTRGVVRRTMARIRRCRS